MDKKIKPLYLLADSQLLFWQNEGQYFMQTVRQDISATAPKAAYVGASNGDEPAFYAVFCEAMACAGIHDCCMIMSEPDAAQRQFLQQADLILLAGGDVALGWQAFRANGLDQLIPQRYAAGAVLIGVSAGAVQLGRYGWKSARANPAGSCPRELFPTFALVPWLVDAHDEADEWRGLKQALLLLGHDSRGLGLPTGGGVIYHADHSLQPVRHPALECRPGPQGEVRTHILIA